MTYSQCYFRNNMALPLICHYLCTKAKIIDKADRLGAALEDTLSNYIPPGGGGRVLGGLKANAGKPEMIRFCVYASGVVCQLLDRTDIVSICQTA